MSYEPIYKITTKGADGFDLTFSIKEKDGTEPATVPKLPIYGADFSFNMSRYGFGLLNTKVTLDILDDGTFYSLFNNNLRNDIGLEITHEDIGELFWGFADLQQLRRILFETGKNGIRVVFYNPSSYMQRIGYNTPEVASAVDDLAVSFSGQRYIYFADYFVNVAFRDYQNPEETCIIHRWVPQVGRLVNPSLPDRCMFNELTFKQAAFADEDVTVADTMGQMSRSFYYRYG